MSLTLINVGSSRDARKLPLGRDDWRLLWSSNGGEVRRGKMVVLGLRDIHVAIDRAVFDDYGWDDLDPDVGHYPTRIGGRWKVSPRVHFEVPRREAPLARRRVDRPPLGG